MHPDFVLLQRLIKKALSLLDKMEREIKGADENSLLDYFLGYARSNKYKAEFLFNFNNQDSRIFFDMFYMICRKMSDMFGTMFLNYSFSSYFVNIIHNTLKQEYSFVIKGKDLISGEISEDGIKSRRCFNLWCLVIFIELITEMKKSFDEITEAVYSDED